MSTYKAFGGGSKKPAAPAPTPPPSSAKPLAKEPKIDPEDVRKAGDARRVKRTGDVAISSFLGGASGGSSTLLGE